MTRVFVAAVAHFCESRRNARVLSAQSRSNYFSYLRQCRAALVRPGLCACFYLQLSPLPLACKTRICRSAPATSRRLHHWLRAVWRDHWWASRIRFLLQTGNAARAAIDLSRLGRRNVQPRRNAWSCCFSLCTTRIGTKSRGQILATIWLSPRRSVCSLGAAPISSTANFMDG